MNLLNFFYYFPSLFISTTSLKIIQTSRQSYCHLFLIAFNSSLTNLWYRMLEKKKDETQKARELSLSHFEFGKTARSNKEKYFDIARTFPLLPLSRFPIFWDTFSFLAFLLPSCYCRHWTLSQVYYQLVSCCFSTSALNFSEIKELFRAKKTSKRH